MQAQSTLDTPGNGTRCPPVSAANFSKYLSEGRYPLAPAEPGKEGCDSLFSLGTLNCWKSLGKQRFNPDDSNVVALVVNTVLTGLYDVLCVQRISLEFAASVVEQLQGMGHNYEFRHTDDMEVIEVAPQDKLGIFYNADLLSPKWHFITDTESMPTRMHIRSHINALICEGYLKALQDESCIQGITFEHKRSKRAICVQNVLLKKLGSPYFSFSPEYDVLGRTYLKNADAVHYTSVKNARMYATTLNNQHGLTNVIYFMAGDFRVTESCIAASYLCELMYSTRFPYICRDIYPVLSDGNVGLFDTRIAYSLASQFHISDLRNFKPVSAQDRRGAGESANDRGIDTCLRTDQIFYGSLCLLDVIITHFQEFQPVRSEHDRNGNAYAGVQLGKGFVFVISSKRLNA